MSSAIYSAEVSTTCGGGVGVFGGGVGSFATGGGVGVFGGGVGVFTLTGSGKFFSPCGVVIVIEGEASSA